MVIYQLYLLQFKAIASDMFQTQLLYIVLYCTYARIRMYSSITLTLFNRILFYSSTEHHRAFDTKSSNRRRQNNGTEMCRLWLPTTQHRMARVR